MPLPAVMALLGERNWYLPKWLHRMPDLTHDEALLPEPRAAQEEGSVRVSP
ncbi:hypothetical protein [Streptomyces sp. NPDC050264]|uniref:hypothetical protein n=1 Tax=Streptomyces sp. NPDC050264 TaxID=3155038 RepID=UPI0034193B1F